MTTLKQTLKDMMTSHSKSEEMMDNHCHYNTETPDYDYSDGYTNRKLIGTKVTQSGYGKELTEGGITFKPLDSYGGEDQGSEYWAVWEFEKDGEIVRIKFDGYYQSYNGADFEDWSFVEPKQKTITVWEWT